jgi:hypothetical protein
VDGFYAAKPRIIGDEAAELLLAAERARGHVTYEEHIDVAGFDAGILYCLMDGCGCQMAATRRTVTRHSRLACTEYENVFHMMVLNATRLGSVAHCASRGA